MRQIPNLPRHTRSTSTPNQSRALFFCCAGAPAKLQHPCRYPRPALSHTVAISTATTKLAGWSRRSQGNVIDQCASTREIVHPPLPTPIYSCYCFYPCSPTTSTNPAVDMPFADVFIVHQAPSPHRRLVYVTYRPGVSSPICSIRDKLVCRHRLLAMITYVPRSGTATLALVPVLWCSIDVSSIGCSESLVSTSLLQQSVLQIHAHIHVKLQTPPPAHTG